MKHKWTPIYIKLQGAPILSDNQGYIVTRGKNIVAIEVDLQSKYCDIDYTISGSDGECGIGIIATKESLYLNEKRKDVCTEIYFPEFSGWTIWASNLSRYTLYVCFIKDNVNLWQYFKMWLKKIFRKL